MVDLAATFTIKVATKTKLSTNVPQHTDMRTLQSNPALNRMLDWFIQDPTFGDKTRLLIGLIFWTFAVFLQPLPLCCHAQRQPKPSGALANSQQIDPVRKDDHVEVRRFGKWYPGKVHSYEFGSAIVKYQYHRRLQTDEFFEKDLRFPNGEGHWMVWKDASGKFKVEARYITRDETSVMIRKEDGSEITIPIEKLSLDLRQKIEQTPVPGKENVIDGVNPIRIGDEVEVRYGTTWYTGVIQRSIRGGAAVQYTYSNSPRTTDFELKDIRYPNGEGHWAHWEDNSGTFKVVARFLSRDDTHVKLLKEDGSQIRVPIDRLSNVLKQTVKKAVTITRLPPKVEFTLAPRTTTFLNNAPRFSKVTLSGTASVERKPLMVGGFGFEIPFGDSISMVSQASTDQENSDGGWIAVGTHATKNFQRRRVTQLFWTKPSQQQVVPGPCFGEQERVVDYSHDQGRLITVKVSRGAWEQPELFCSYRVRVGEAYATPEASWGVASKKRSYGRGSDFLVRLVGKNQLLLADGKAVSLYDFQTRELVYTIDHLAHNHFVLHPTKHYFIVQQRQGGLSLHATSSGQQLAREPGGTGRVGFGFSQDGQRLIRVGSKRIQIWDLLENTAPQVLQTRNLKGHPTSTVTLLDDDWIWASSHLYSTARELVVWSYAGGGVKIAHSQMRHKQLIVAGTMGRSSQPTTALIGIADVPHQAVIDQMKSTTEGSIVMLKAGSGIKLDAEGSSEVREGLLRVISENGWHEDPASEVVLSGSAKRGKSQTITYDLSRSILGRFRPFGAKHDAQTVTVTPWVQSVSVSYRGRQAWSSRRGGVPYSLTLLEGETLQGKISEATQPSYSVFKNLKIPSEMVYPQFSSGLGRTAITVNGFKDTHYSLDIPKRSKP